MVVQVSPDLEVYVNAQVSVGATVEVEVVKTGVEVSLQGMSKTSPTQLKK